jgi:hypothetical protein
MGQIGRHLQEPSEVIAERIVTNDKTEVWISQMDEDLSRIGQLMRLRFLLTTMGKDRAGSHLT